MNLEQANRLGSGDRLRVGTAGLERHGLGGDRKDGTYVSQFESPKNGRMVVVRLEGDAVYGFRLDEVELLGH